MTRLVELERTALARTTRSEISRALWWCIAAPALAVWPFLSAFPLFEMLSREPSLGLIATRSILLATGFWAVAALYAAYLFARVGGAATRRRDGGLTLGLYAACWTALYLAVAFVV